MFNELDKYKEQDHFFVMPDSDLEKVCNAPDDKEGVYIVHVLANDRIEMAYIGFSLNSSLKNEIVNGLHYNGKPRNQAWPRQMKEQNIDGLDIYWYVTRDEVLKDKPIDVWKRVIDVYMNLHGRLPKWNRI